MGCSRFYGCGAGSRVTEMGTAGSAHQGAYRLGCCSSMQSVSSAKTTGRVSDDQLASLIRHTKSPISAHTGGYRTRITAEGERTWLHLHG
jgi:hypothetical protein